MGLIDQVQRLRRRLLGLDAAQERFDLLQQRIDTVGGDLGKLGSDMASLRQVVHRLVDGQRLAARDGAPAATVARGGLYRPARSERLGFLLHSLELVNHYGSVWDLMEPGSFEVVLHGPTPEASAAMLAPWGCTVRTSAKLLASGEVYDWLVSNHPVEVGERPLIRQLAQRQVRFMYAAGKSGWNLASWNALYDVILCFGPHHQALLAEASRATVVQMGYPRFDRYFNEQPEGAALQARYGCDPSRPTVVWLPTWKSLSSVGHFDDEIGALAGHYNVVAKLHPLMVEQEPERVAALRRQPLTRLITDTEDNLPLYQLADFMLFDYGGPPLAAVYADKPLLLLDVPGAQDEELLGADSPDLVIRQHLPSVTPADRAIAARLCDPATWASQREARRALRARYFAPYYGFSADVAASALSRLPQLLEQVR